METKTHRILRLILFLSNGHPKSKEECNSFMSIGDTAFYNYRNVLLDTGFDLHQKEGKYWIEYPDEDYQVLRNILHFTEEETYLLSKSIDLLDEKPGSTTHLKQKLVSFLNKDKAMDAYIRKEKSQVVQALRKACQERKQILLVNYASGNSQTVKNRMVEPFEFKDDFNLVWAFDTALKQNRQFKVCRMERVQETPFAWEYEHSHRLKPVDCFRNSGELDKEIEFTLTLKAKNLLIEEYPLTERFLTMISDKQYRLKAPVAKYEGPGRFVLGLAEDIELAGDKGFLNYLKIKIQKSQHLVDGFAI